MTNQPTGVNMTNPDPPARVTAIDRIIALEQALNMLIDQHNKLATDIMHELGL